MFNRAWTVSVIILLGTATDAFAQDERRTGLVVSTGAAVGLILAVTDRVAVRPEISFNTSTVESEATSDDGIDTTSVNLAVSAPFTLRQWDNLSTYVTPRFSFSRATGSSTFRSGSNTTTFESTNTAYGFGGSFGAQYRLAERFAVFGETGLTFTFQETDSDSAFSSGDTTARAFGTRNQLGIIFYF